MRVWKIDWRTIWLMPSRETCSGGANFWESGMKSLRLHEWAMQQKRKIRVKWSGKNVSFWMSQCMKINRRSFWQYRWVCISHGMNAYILTKRWAHTSNGESTWATNACMSTSRWVYISVNQIRISFCLALDLIPLLRTFRSESFCFCNIWFPRISS